MLFPIAPNFLHAGPPLCAGILPDSAYRALYASLMCGFELAPGAQRQMILDFGIVHLFIVSGAHLFFIERALRHGPEWVRFGVVAGYAWLTDFGVPVVRALARQIARSLTLRLGWSSLQVEALATVGLLLASPLLFLSRSFLLSWFCALALRTPWPRTKWRTFNFSVRCYLFLLPFTRGSPLVIFWNSLLGPFVSELLFPLSGLAILVPGVVHVADLGWRILLYILEHGPHGSAAPLEITSSWFWVVPLVAHVFLLVMECKWRRARAFSY